VTDDVDAVLLERGDDVGDFRTPQVADVGFVGEPEHEHATLAERVAGLTQRLHHQVGDVVWHRLVDRASGLD